MPDTGLSVHALLLKSIVALDKREAVSLVRDLLLAEAQAQGLTPAPVTMPLAEDVGDGGIDGETRLTSPVAAVDVGAGWNAWQVKSGDSVPNPKKELRRRRHRGIHEAIEEGANYSLVWTRDGPETLRRACATKFVATAEEIRPGTKVRVVLAEDIARWVQQHPSCLASLLPLDGFARMEPLTGLEVENGTTAIERSIAEHLLAQDRVVLRVLGAPGAGKSTAIRMAADRVAARIATMVAGAPSSAVDATVVKLARQRLRIAVVIGQCGPEHARVYETAAEMSQGNLRIVAEGSDTRQTGSTRTRDVELRPMMPGTAARLLEACGVPAAAAQRAVRDTGGNPLLLSAVAADLLESGSVSRIAVAERLVEGMNRRCLAAIAILPSNTSDGPSLRRLASIFDLGDREIEDAAEEAERRSLTTSSQYPRLPDVVAAHVISASVRHNLAWLTEAIARLSDAECWPAIRAVSMAGPSARGLIDRLIDRVPRWELPAAAARSEVWDLEERVVTLADAARASPVAAAAKLRIALSGIPWSERSHWDALSSLAEAVAAACAEIQHGAPDEDFGAELLLETASAASWGGGPLEAALRSMLAESARTGSPQVIRWAYWADALGEKAVRCLLRTAPDDDRVDLPLTRLAAWMAGKHPEVRTDAAAAIARRHARNGDLAREQQGLMRQSWWPHTARALLVAASYAQGIPNAAEDLGPDARAVLTELVRLYLGGEMGRQLGLTIDAEEGIARPLSRALAEIGCGIEIADRYDSTDDWRSLQMDSLLRSLAEIALA